MRTPPPVRAATLLGAALLTALLAGCGLTAPAAEPPAGAGARPAAVVYRTATCDCCAGHVDHLREAGFSVRTEVVDDLGAVKDDLGVPPELASCHTTVVGGYFVEGHVPADVVAELLAERPAIDGIALPGMPAGSPGMPGPQVEPLAIQGVDGGHASLFATR